MSEPAVAAPVTEAAPVPDNPGAMLDAALDGLEPANDAPEGEPAAEAPPGTPAEETAAAPSAPVPEPDDDDFSVSAEQPWTPERATRMLERQREQQRKLDKFDIIVRKKEAKIARREQDTKQERERVELVQRQIAIDLAALRNAGGKEVLDALGRLSGRPGHELYEEMSLSLVGQKKADPRDAVIAELRTAIGDLTKKIESKDQREETAATYASIRHDVSIIVDSAEDWPALAAEAAANPEKTAKEFEQLYVAESKQKGQWVDIEAFADRIERALRKQGSPRQTQNGEAERDLRAASAKPAGKAHGAPGKTLTPSHTQANGGSRRELTEEERVAELAADPDFLRNLGLPG